MARQLTTKQRKFADEYLITGNGKKAAKKAYKLGNLGGIHTDSVARSIASENLTKPNVREYLAEKANRASEIVFELAEGAINEGVRLGASKDILDRAGFKPVDKQLIITAEIEPSADILELAQRLNQS